MMLARAGAGIRGEGKTSDWVPAAYSLEPMPAQAASERKLRVLIAGAGVGGLEGVLALADLAPDGTELTVIAPDAEFVYRPMTVREPFAYSLAARYPVERIVHHAGAELLVDGLEWVDPTGQVAHTSTGAHLAYDALLLATGAEARARYPKALTIDARRMDETLHGLIQDVEGGYLNSLAFVAPSRMAWPLPIYELALMTAGRAYDMGIELSVTIVTPVAKRPIARRKSGEFKLIS